MAPNNSQLEALTYPAPNLKDNTLDDNICERNLPLDNGRHTLEEPRTDLGVLDTLPLEILQEVLVQIDLRSLTNVRGVSRRAMQVVDSLPQYQSIIKHGLASLRSILAIEIGTLVSCRRLFHTLTTATCEKCHDFAGFIYLPTCSRVCFLCFSEEIEYLPLLATEVQRRFALPSSIVATLSHLKSVPGSYSPNDKVCPSRLTLYDYDTARQAAEAHHGSNTIMQQRVDNTYSKRLKAYQSRVLERSRGKDGPIPRQPPHVKGYDGKSSNPKRFMAIVRVPWVDAYTRAEEWGFHCVGCLEKSRSRSLHWRRKYSASSFTQHILECGRISNGCHTKR